MKARRTIEEAVTLAVIAFSCAVLPVRAQEPRAPAKSEQTPAPMADLPRIDKRSVQVLASISEVGGQIIFTAANPDDVATRDALRAYGETLRERLRAGDFAPLLALFPAAQALVERVNTTPGIGITTAPLPAGFQVGMAASGQDSRTAIHDFLQVPKTSANRSARHPGNNLGWDAERQPDIDK